MSSLRSRSGGSFTTCSLTRAKRSPRNFPSFTNWWRSRCVAQTTRTSTRSGAVAAEREDLARLQDAQELRLRLERHVADLVEEERPAVGELDEARLVAVGAAEGAAPVAEELALEQVVRDGGAVDGLEAPAPPRDAVQLARGDLLARARLAEEHARELRRRDALELGGDEVHLPAADERLRSASRRRSPRMRPSMW